MSDLDLRLAVADAPRLYRILGFCDVPGKPASDASITYFRETDCFNCAALPKPDALAIYAAERGYWPTGKLGAHPNCCDPIYRIIGDVPHRVRPREEAA